MTLFANGHKTCGSQGNIIMPYHAISMPYHAISSQDWGCKFHKEPLCIQRFKREYCHFSAFPIICTTTADIAAEGLRSQLLGSSFNPQQVLRTIVDGLPLTKPVFDRRKSAGVDTHWQAVNPKGDGVCCGSPVLQGQRLLQAFSQLDKVCGKPAASFLP